MANFQYEPCVIDGTCGILYNNIHDGNVRQRNLECLEQVVNIVLTTIFMNTFKLRELQKESIEVSDFRVLICGTARNVEKKLDHFMSVTQNSFQDFSKISYLVCESFSNDGTWNKLQFLAERIDDFKVIKDSSNVSSEDHRTVRIASARARIQDFVKLHSDEFDFVVMMDLDGINRSLTRRAILSCWKYNNWDVASANQPLKYYDLWALRVSGWVEQDIWKVMRDKNLEIGLGFNKKTYLKQFTRSIPRNSSPIPVDSAFGGLAIYTTESFLVGEYSGIDSSGNEICEHVPFHAEISRRGFQIYIIPSLVNLSPIEQTLMILKQNLKKVRNYVKRTS